MADWTVRRWSDVSACWLQCPNCLAVSRFERYELAALYASKPDQKPFAKCINCDFQPYLPLELKSATSMEVVLWGGPGTVWAPVNEATTRVVAETYCPPRNLGSWRNLKLDSPSE